MQCAEHEVNRESQVVTAAAIRESFLGCDLWARPGPPTSSGICWCLRGTAEVIEGGQISARMSVNVLAGTSSLSPFQTLGMESMTQRLRFCVSLRPSGDYRHRFRCGANYSN